MAVTDNPAMAAHMRRFRNHGIDSDHRSREKTGAHAYDMGELGYNYRLPDVQCALGLAQLTRLQGWVAARQRLAGQYDQALAGSKQVIPLSTHPDRSHARHIYVVKLTPGIDRDRTFARLREAKIGANVHYAPVYLHSYYRNRGYAAGLAPVAEAASNQLLTLPLYPAMTDDDVRRVAGALKKAVTP